MRIPLVNVLSAIVLDRLDITATRAENPPGDPATGYHPELQAPYPYKDPVTGVLSDTRQYMAAVRVPCQVEVMSWERLAKEFAGDAPDVNTVFVLHHMHLTTLGLLEANGNCLIKKGDRISAIEKNGIPGTVSRPLPRPFYVFEVRPAGWGLGPLGHDLQLLYVTERPSRTKG